MASLTHQIVPYLDRYLRTADIPDYPNAHNGLQLDGREGVRRIGAAVDACFFTVDVAARLGVDLLLVHHGLAWNGLMPMTKGRYQLWKRAMDAGIAVYSSHLPLDVHPQVGNTALLCAAVGLHDTQPFLPYKGTMLGQWAELHLERDTLQRRLRDAVEGPVRICPGGPAQVRRVGVVTGGAGAEIREAAAAGIDTFITGEGPHWTFPLAEELEVNILYGGHYATETFGVKALAAHLGEKFSLPWDFIDHPSGL